jgi:hypothetical protein
MRTLRSLLVLGTVLSFGTACPKDDMGSAGEKLVRPDASTANVVKISSTTRPGEKIACAKIIDPVAFAPMIGEAEVTLQDGTAGGEQEATSVCSIRKTGKVLSEKEQERLQTQTGFKLGVQAGDEICQLRMFCAYHYDIADAKKQMEAQGQICTSEIGDLTCVNKVQAGAEYRHVVTVLDGESKCRYVVSPTTITEEAPVKACAKAFTELITVEKIKAP